MPRGGTSRFVAEFDAVEARLGTPGFKLIDASWYLPQQNRDAAAEFAEARIPGAQRFDLDAVVMPGSPLPHMLPPPEIFAGALGAMGISEADEIVVYDGPGMFSAPRVWWMCRVFGASKVRVLNGGFDRWKAEGRSVETAAPVPPPPVRFDARFNARAVADLADIRAAVERGTALILDARSPGRFAGTAPEPRAGLRSGHMPGAENLPYSMLTDSGRLKSDGELRRILARHEEFEEQSDAGHGLTMPVIATCGSGVTAAVIILALATIGHANHRLYDGSWAEWGGRDDTPVETGAE
ncbi:MAG: 3-mercaptopyruvate sulfurtransferase [Rhizobiaceae bacterium]|nr:3-mercaptopyruvate sulfurtransferase [Rhizobiaceae bacterium]